MLLHGKIVTLEAWKLPRSFILRLLINFISFYQQFLSFFTSGCCKYYPSCSEFSKQSLIKYGILRGIFVSIIRINKCNPFSKGGVDLVE